LRNCTFKTFTIYLKIKKYFVKRKPSQKFEAENFERIQAEAP